MLPISDSDIYCTLLDESPTGRSLWSPRTLERAHLAFEPAPELLADRVVVHFRAALSQARVRNQELTQTCSSALG